MRITKADLRPGLFLTGGAFPVSGGDVLLRSRAAPAPVSYGAPALPPPSLAEITARIAAAYPHGSGPCPRAARDQTAMTGLALELRLRLRRLQREHQSAPQPVTVALTAPVDQPQVVEGFAATTDIDLDRVKFRRYAFTWTTPVLLYKHIEPAGRMSS
jgi:hypothetical protein